MSHITRLDKAQIKNVSAFIAACAELGMIRVERNTQMKAWDSSDSAVAVEVACFFESSQYGIGLIKNANGSYDMVSDWSLTGHQFPAAIKKQFPSGFYGKDGAGGTGFAACEALRGRMLRDTAKHTLVATYRKQGFRVAVTEDENHNLNVRMTRAR